MKHAKMNGQAKPPAAGPADPVELDAKGIQDLLKEHMDLLGPLLSELKTPVPPGLTAGDRLAVTTRRADILGRAQFLHGLALGTLTQSRRSRVLTAEQYQEQLGRLHSLVGSRR